MAEFKTVDEQAFAISAARGTRQGPLAVSVRLDQSKHQVVVSLAEGIEFAFDPANEQGLERASFDDLVGVVVEGAGSTLHFPKLDADLSVALLSAYPHRSSLDRQRPSSWREPGPKRRR